MKAIIISALLFFSLRAMSADVGENKGAICSASDQTNKREAKAIEDASQTVKEQLPVKTKSK